MSTTTSSTGGRIINIPGGLIHYGNTDRFTVEATDAITKAGRPVTASLSYDFSQFLTPVTLSTPQGRVVKFK
jgi:hypothetical protein